MWYDCNCICSLDPGGFARQKHRLGRDNKFKVELVQDNVSSVMASIGTLGKGQFATCDTLSCVLMLVLLSPAGGTRLLLSDLPAEVTVDDITSYLYNREVDLENVKVYELREGRAVVEVVGLKGTIMVICAN